MSHIQQPQSKRRKLHALAAMTFAGALTLSACATADPVDNADNNGPAPPPEETNSQIHTVEPAADGEDPGGVDTLGVPATAPLGNPDTAPKEQAPAPTELDVVDVRMATHDSFDRIVFDMAGTGVPGWHVDYNEHPVQQGSGHPFEFEGSIALDVMIHGVTGPADVADLPGTGGVVTEVRSGITHHGSTHFVIGMNEVLPYSVQIIQEPQRLVIDILHEGDGAPSPIGQPHIEDRAQDPVAPYERVVTAVRLATHEGFDRVVFDTAGSGGAGWFTEYTATPFQLGSGLPVAYNGNVALNLNLSGMVRHTGDGHEQIDLGIIPGAGGVVNEVVSGINHHGQTQFVIGMDEVLPYSIQVLEEPHRVVVDILHS